MVEGLDLEEARSVFSTKEQSRTSDDYFLSSGDKIRFFWEVSSSSSSSSSSSKPWRL